MIIRPATPKDAGQIVGFWNPQIRDTAVTFTTLEKRSEGLASEIAAKLAENKAFLVAEKGDALWGFATYSQFRSGPGYANTMEHTVILAADARGKGLGQMLMAALEDQARLAGVHAMIAGVSSENPVAIAFHEKIGYRRVGVMPEVGFKFGRWMDLILLQKLL